MHKSLSVSDVSRETLEKLKAFEALVLKWNPRINLVSKADAAHVWDRHIKDSLQLVNLTTDVSTWTDLGSGGGFPGIVVAIAVQYAQPQHMVLIDSDSRKCAFLKTAVRELDLSATVISDRLDAAQTPPSSTVSARALMPLDGLLGYCQRFLKPDGTALFQKGRNWRDEVRDAERRWSFDLDVIDSKTSSDAAILRLSNIRKLPRHDR